MTSNNITLIQQKINNFSDLLDSLSKTEDKKKLLWKDAYQNAIEDRESANILVRSYSESDGATVCVILTRRIRLLAVDNTSIRKFVSTIASPGAGTLPSRS